MGCNCDNNEAVFFDVGIIEQGAKGEKGDKGDAGTISVGTVTRRRYGERDERRHELGGGV